MTTDQSAAYEVGDYDERPWGSYVVTGIGTTDDGHEFCEKDITVKPGQVLSLQSHKKREEFWTVKDGILDIVCDDERLTLKAGDSIHIPKGAVHCMANVQSNQPCVVFERQVGICREDDIVRYLDAYGRADDEGAGDAEQSRTLYETLLQQCKAMAA